MSALVRKEWIGFRSRGRITALLIAVLITVLFGLLLAFTERSTCSVRDVEVACPTDPVGPQGRAVSDQFYFTHQALGDDGSITVRMTEMTGVITYPPPDHDEIVPGLVPWAKAGIIVKDGSTPGSSYAALMLTGDHGVRMQHDYVHDTAGQSGGVSPTTPRWLRLSRSGNTITGAESSDGVHWTKVGTARLPGLPETVRVGLFATSPGDLTLKPTGLGASTSQTRFTQASATFDNVTVDGGAGTGWTHEAVGDMGNTDWERSHRAPGTTESNGTLTVTGSGDIGPVATVGGHAVEDTLVGLPIALIVVIAVSARFLTGKRRGDQPAHAPLGARVLAAKAFVVGATAFLTGLVAAGIAVPIGTMVLRANGSSVLAVPALVELRTVVAAAALVAVTTVLALALCALLRRAWAAVLVTTAAVVLPYVVGTLPLLPDEISGALLRFSPAAGFAVLQTLQEFPPVIAHYAPQEGYFPLPGWAGLAVLCGCTAALLGLAVIRERRRATGPGPEPKWR